MNTFDFWQKWLLGASFFFSIFGIVVAALGDSFLFDAYNAHMSDAFWSSDTVPEEAAQMKGFLLGPLGGTITGSYVLMIYIAHYPFRRKERWAYQASLYSLLSWFTIDSIVSILHNALFNVYLVNLFALIVIGLPLLFTRKYFYPSHV